MILMEEKLLERFTKTNCKKTNEREFRIEKVIKRKDNKLYIKRKGYHNSLTVGSIKNTSNKCVNIFREYILQEEK